MDYSSEEKIIKYLMFTQMKGIGSVTQNVLLDLCVDVESCFEIGYEKLLQADSNSTVRIGIKRIESFISQREDENLRYKAEEIMEASKQAGIDIIVREDIQYPNRFRDILDMPVLIYCKGNLKINEFENTVGIVGARRCTSEGKSRAIVTAQTAVGDDMAVISGMAKGIDSYAHTAALMSQGYTVAVLGNGADICYPSEHIKLYTEIVNRGCILSEYPPGSVSRHYCFPRRNRLIAALSDKLYVIDAGRHSGTVSTVASGRKYGKEIVDL